MAKQHPRAKAVFSEEAGKRVLTTQFGAMLVIKQDSHFDLHLTRVIASRVASA
jgi:hypothetical protein